MKPFRQPTLGEIATRSKLSISSVSRILSGKRIEGYSEKTVERVRKLASEMLYRPNQLVRGMQTGRTGLVGLLVPAHGDFYSQIIAGIHDTLVCHSLSPIVLWPKEAGSTRNGRTELEQIHTLVDLRVEGIILRPGYEDASPEYLHEIFERKIPLVVIDRKLPKVRTNFVGTDITVGVDLAVDHLFQKGHRVLGFFGSAAGTQRLGAFRLAVQSLGATGIEVLTSNWTPTVDRALELITSNPRPTGILAGNDHFAQALYEAAIATNLKIPGDVSIIGFGDLPFSQFLNPPLTTLDQHVYEIGTSAAMGLISAITNPGETPRTVLLPPELKIRESTA